MDSTSPEVGAASETMEMAVRRSSTTSESSKLSCEGAAKASENPLMRLVDAALSPNSSINATASTDASAMEESESATKMTECSSTGSSTAASNAAPAFAESRAASTAATSAPTNASHAPLPPPPPFMEGSGLNDKVIRGTVQDLVARQEKLTFAEYLMLCLGDESNHDVLQWMPCGTQFTITNHRKFTMERMPILFKIRNMSSFVRKLTRWGFSRVHEKETGNSDIFKHEFFVRDQPDLCKKIRCVNRAAAAAAMATKPTIALPHHGGALPMHHSHHDVLNNSHRSSDSLNHSHHSHQSHHRKMMSDDYMMPMISPRRSMGHAMPFAHGRSPHANSSPYSSSRYHHSSPSGHYMGGSHGSPSRRMNGAPRVSPEYEREMLGHHHGGNHSSAFRPGPPQVYSPPTMGRTMSAAAEYELEQVLLERQRARLYREQQRLSQAAATNAQSQRSGASPPPTPATKANAAPAPSAAYNACPSTPRMGSGSERSSSLDLSDRRFSMIGTSSDLDFLGGSNGSMTSALESLEREVGEYDLDMSPREAMLRAVLHKRQQQRAQKRASATQASGGSGGGGILKHSSSYFDPAEGPPPPSSTRHSSYYR